MARRYKVIDDTGEESWLAEAALPSGSPVILDSEFSTSSTTLGAVTGLSFEADANVDYLAIIYTDIKGSLASAGPKWGWTGPASPTSMMANGLYSRTLSETQTLDSQTDFGQSTQFANSSTDYRLAQFTLRLENGANAGTVQFCLASESAGNVIYMAQNTVMMVYRLG